METTVDDHLSSTGQSPSREAVFKQESGFWSLLITGSTEPVEANPKQAAGKGRARGCPCWGGWPPRQEAPLGVCWLRVASTALPGLPVVAGKRN